MANTTGTKFGGRGKGGLNKTTQETKAVLQVIISNELEKIPDLLAELTPKDKLDAITKLLPYLLPRQTEIAIEPILNEFQPLTINLIENGNTD